MRIPLDSFSMFLSTVHVVELLLPLSEDCAHVVVDDHSFLLDGL
jgi:hypothetical protein